jgi:hypothetical protein
VSDTQMAIADATGDPTLPAETPEQPVSIADHAAQYDPKVEREAAPEPEPIPANETPAQAQQRRDRETGQFRQGKVRHRAKSQQASAEDVPRIQALTARAKAAEEKAAALEAKYANGNGAAHVPRETPRPQTQTTGYAQQQHDPEPQDTDEKYADNYPQYLKDIAAWNGREQFRQMSAQQQWQQSQQQRVTAFQQRVTAAKALKPDFEQVAFTPVPWQPDSLVDRFIMEDDAGAEMLYYLQSNPAERDSLGQMSELSAWKFLSLLSQRLLSSSSEAAGMNGAAPRPEFKIASKPPTPLRTEAERATPTGPPTDGSLSIAEHTRAFGQTRRSR